MGEQQAEFAERTVDILESKIDTLQETLYKEKLNYRIRLINIKIASTWKFWYTIYRILKNAAYYVQIMLLQCQYLSIDIKEVFQSNWIRLSIS